MGVGKKLLSKTFDLLLFCKIAEENLPEVQEAGHF